MTSERSTSAPRGPHRLSAEQATVRAAAALEAEGAGRDAATLQAAHLTEAELRGHTSHGLRRLPVLIERLRAGLIDPDAQPELRWTADATLRVDGRRGFGPLTAYAAIDALLQRSARTGVAVGALHHTHHLGMLAPYVERIAEAGCVGVVLSSTEGLVHPWGGSGALLGTNPLAVGVPVAQAPLTLDMSTGSVSAGKILDHLERGRPLPDGWAVDADGRPTRDPAEAVRGAISPFGGSKGYALGITLGAVVGVLTGTEFGLDVVGTLDAEHETTKGDVIIVLRIEAFGQPARSEGLAAYLERVRASGVDGTRVRIPGDRARQARADALADGFDVTDEVWEFLHRAAAAGSKA
ncbi:Ldh family oxidoreductase [Microbacterium album]|uniref:Dehydrogenase n=1 Tax=Microbacterium album TaxID=2053191 RepID=A0A917IFX7_9MICO|nr:Ldh family oxidoreductase [Microbacterium album]GGH42446.1 dehydrogenase [Microbacterium album]